MKDRFAILLYLKEKNISVSLSADKKNLRLTGDLSNLSNEDKDQITALKSEIIAFLLTGMPLDIPVQPSDNSPYPLAPGQYSIWMHDELLGKSNAYSIPLVYKLHLTDFNFDNFRKAIEIVVRQNEILRVKIHVQDGIPFHQPVTATDFSAQVLKFDFSDSEDCEIKSRIEIQKICDSPFDSEKQIPWQIGWFILKDDWHYFLLNIHHILADGESLNIITKSILAVYSCLQNGKKIPEPGVYQYRDYVAWIRNKEQFRESKQFWISHLEEYAGDFRLPPDINSSGISSYGNQSISLDSEITDKVLRYSAEKKVSVTCLFYAAFAIVLSKRSNCDDLTLGIPAGGRNNPVLESLIGNLVNTLPLRIRLNYTELVSDFLAEIQKQLFGLLEHQHYPLNYILEDIPTRFSEGENTLFSILISYIRNNENAGTTKENIEIRKTTSLYDLSCIILEQAGKFQIEFEFNASLYRQNTIERIASEMEFVLMQITGHQNNRLAQIQLATDSEHELILKSFSQNKTFISQGKHLAGNFEKQVQESGNAIAVKCSDFQLTYFELNLIQNKISAALVSAGIKTADRIVVQLQNCNWLPALIPAIWNAGAVYVPADTNIPDERLQFIIDDCEASFIIDERNLQSLLQHEPELKNDTVPEYDPQALAYLIYTSGTTGNPKAVCISHNNLNCILDAEQQLLGLDQTLVTCPITSPAFDVSFLEIILPLYCGGTVAVPGNNSLEAGVLAQFLFEHEVNLLQATPSWLNYFIEEITPEETELLSRKLKTICCGGESLSDALIQKILLRFPKIRLNNHYGPTETTIDAVVKTNPGELNGNNIGKPIGQTRAFITDSCGNLLPADIAGELVLGGPSVAAGYWNNTHLTEEKFKRFPFCEGLLYCTGDLAKWNADGEIIFMGRTDQQVKLRGYRIETNEISSVLLKIPGVSDAHTALAEEKLHCWVCGNELSKEMIMEKLREKLPAPMIPSSIIFIDKMPRTLNGKIALRELSFPEEIIEHISLPQNNLEFRLQKIWQEILNKEITDFNKSFFEYGGHSLTAMRLISKISVEFNIKSSLKDIFRFSTLAEQAELIAAGEKLIQLQIPTAATADRYPASAGQKRIWLLSQSEEGSRTYHIPSSIILNEKTDVNRLVTAIEKTIDRHESLRTVFCQDENGELFQCIKTRHELQFSVEIADLAESTENELELIRKKISAVSEKTFSLSAGPLMRVVLFKTAENKLLVFFLLHHIICDGWSLDIIRRDILAFYKQNETASQDEAEPLRIQYKDYAVWQNQSIENGLLKKEKEFWVNLFDGDIAVLDLPAQKKRPAIKTFNGELIRVKLSGRTRERLENYSAKKKSGIFSSLLACFTGTLYRYTGQTDIVTGIPVAGRMHPELENQVGFYTNTIALRNQFNEQDSFSDLFEKVNRNLIDGLENQQYPFDLLLDDLAIKRDLSRNPLFDVFFVLETEDASRESNDSSGEMDTINPAGERYAHFDFTLTATVREAETELALIFNTDIYSRPFAEQFLQHYISFAETVLENENVPLSQIDFLSAAELNELVIGFNNTRSPYPDNHSVGELFHEQALKTPDNTALIFEERRYSYNELNRIASQFAFFLNQKFNLSAGQTAAINIERSDKVIIAILAVLKCGASWLPLDPAFPDKHISRMLGECNCSVCIDKALFSEFENSPEKFSGILEQAKVPSSSKAYIMYTSGSTGIPKGVEVSHRNIIRLVRGSEFVHLGPENTLLSTGSVSFDATTFEFWGMLLNGGTLVLCSNIKLLDPFAISELIQKEKVNMLWLTSGLLNQFVDSCISLFAGLHTLIAGGDVLSPQHLRKLRKYYPSLRMINGYGPTENTCFSLCFSITDISNAIPIGTPVSNSTAYILNSSGKVQPPWVAGEIYVGGDGLAIGYLGQPELTAEKFKHIASLSGERVYSTGDRGRWLPDGKIEFLGRMDDQIKIRGYRAEPGETEFALAGLNDIESAAVIAVRESSGYELHAFIVSKKKIDEKEIRDLLQQELPPFQIPSRIIQIDRIPLTANGKTDKAALLKTAETLPPKKQEYIPPENAAEEKLVQIWSEILGIPENEISIYDHFFDRGGNSLKLIRMISRIQVVFGKKISAVQVFSAPDIQSLGKILLEEKSNELAHFTEQFKESVETMEDSINLFNSN